MYPILLKIGPVVFSSYFVFLALAIALPIWLSVRGAPARGLKPIDVLDLGLVVGVSGFLGGRLFHALFSRPDYYLEAPMRLLRLWNGGYVLYGGFILATAAGWLFTRRRRMPFSPMADLAAPNIALGFAIGRVGCFLSGCCFGSPSACGWPLTVRFPMATGGLGESVWAVQIFDALFNLSLWGGLRLWRYRQRFSGELFATFLLLYSVGRFCIEFLRGDAERGFPWGWSLSTSQGLSVGVFVVGLIYYRYAYLIRREIYGSTSLRP